MAGRKTFLPLPMQNFLRQTFEPRPRAIAVLSWFHPSHWYNGLDDRILMSFGSSFL